MIRLNSVHKFFNKGRQNEIHVINDVSLELPERGMVAVFGKSGCGKTTLLNVIGGLDGFREGEVTVEGQDIRKSTDDVRNRYIGYIFQNYNLNKDESCFENVADALRLCGMTDKAEIEERVMAALANVGMEKYSRRPPDTLSGGQQQRIAIARAIVKNPRIVLADEPTGNLDETNTVLVMDLLKQISREHLVVLVTHEANLVDHYCDTVIELSDGRVAGIRNNRDANGYTARDKNDIFLGELQKTELCDAHAEVSYYGAAPDVPLRLRVVNSGGKLYLQVDSPDVQILDAFSEVKLREGVYEEHRRAAEKAEKLDMSKLPPIIGGRQGRLFSFGSSVKSGYAANFRHRKKSKKILRGCMCLFAAVIVFMSALFGTAFAKLFDARDAYNHNVFYVFAAPDGEASRALVSGLADPDSGIDYLSLQYNIPSGDAMLKFTSGFFETFLTDYFDESFEANAVVLGEGLIGDAPLVAGKKDALAENEMVITTQVADKLLESSSLGYISDYEDLLGLVCNRLNINSKTVSIAGIVRRDEPAVYLCASSAARHAMRGSDISVMLASDFGMTLESGETVLFYPADLGINEKLPEDGKTVLLHGMDFTLRETLMRYPRYEAWLAAKGIQKPTIEKFDGTRAAYWKDYYSELDTYLRSNSRFANDDLYTWLYVEKGIEIAKFYAVGNDEAYAACLFEERNGRLPSDRELEELLYDGVEDFKRELSRYIELYEQEFYAGAGRVSIYQPTYLVSDSDYIALSRVRGETDASALSGYINYGYAEDVEIKGMSYSAKVDVEMVESVGRAYAYTVVHSNDPRATAAYLDRTLADLETGASYLTKLLSPDDVYARVMSSYREEIIVNLVSMAIILALMCLCMYFIMRSSLMNRIKEVGIYRAIGVSKRNLIFRFLVEALVLTTLTVFIGYLLSAAFIGICLGLSPLISVLFFFPTWYALIVLAVLYAMCLVCGTLPILGLLRRSPSEILAKYDI